MQNPDNSKRNWGLPATDKQLALLCKGGRYVKEGLTKGEASRLIEELIASGDLYDGYSLLDFERHDPNAPIGRRERRFCCPVCLDKPIDKVHRSLCVDTSTGLWICHRCQSKGKLKEFQESKSKQYISRRDQAHIQAQKLFAVQSSRKDESFPPTTSEEVVTEQRWRSWWDNAKPILNTLGGEYLASRAIPLTIAEVAGCRFSTEWYGRSAVLFPIYDRAGQLVAVCGRFTDGYNDPKTMTGGPKSKGIFHSLPCPLQMSIYNPELRPNVLKVNCVAIVEGPFDALALASIGIASIALIGVSWPNWLPSALAFKSLLLASDNDKAGDELAINLEEKLLRFGAHCLRLKPSKLKDWAEQLEHFGLEAMHNRLRPFAICPGEGNRDDLEDDDIRMSGALTALREGRETEAHFLVRLLEPELRGSMYRLLKREMVRKI